jgi:CRP/FNR family transcriptional regulator
MNLPISQLLPRLPFWANLSPDEKAVVSQRAVTKRFAKGQLVSSNSSSCLGIVLILSGGVRVGLVSDEGREITLFRAGEGEVCVSTASCVIRQLAFDTDVTAETDTAILVIPSSVCAKLMESNIHVRAFVFEMQAERYSQTVRAIQAMLFKRFDQRLATYLVSEHDRTGSAEVKKTQEEIARDVNSAREVVARMLHEFSTRGLVEIRRGSIRLLDIEGLRKIG